jgi:cyclopropane fatty-acyl-phospholipid synthase-like methyltransferase
MLTPAMRNWFGRSSRSTVTMLLEPTLDLPRDAAAERDPPAVARPPEKLWDKDRLTVTDRLWGAGYIIPGGEIELLRLAKPLGLSSAASLLLLGVGAGGTACSLVTALGVWVNGFEADPDLVSLATDRVTSANMGKRARIDRWNPADPSFARHYYHHALALEPILGQLPETVLSAISGALKPGGQLMMTELVADVALDPNDPLVAQWARLERRDARALPTEIGITRVMGRQGYDVRIVEDLSQRFMHQGIMGWRRLVRALQEAKPSRHQAKLIVREAEVWLVRLRLFREGRLRLVRWHAIGSGLG